MEYNPLPMKEGQQIQFYDMRVDPKNFPPPDDSMKLKQFTGRKFRDLEEEPLCELPDTAIETTSIE